MKAIIKAIIAVMIVATLSMPAMANLEINGSSGWQNTSFDNTTYNINNIYLSDLDNFNDSIIDSRWGIKGNISNITESNGNLSLLSPGAADGLNITINFTSLTFKASLITSSSQDTVIQVSTSVYSDYQLLTRSLGTTWTLWNGSLNHIGNYDTLEHIWNFSLNDTHLNVYRDSVLKVSFADASSNFTYLQLGAGGTGGRKYNNISLTPLRYSTIGNTTHYGIDAGSGNVVSGYNISVLTPANTNYTLTYIDNVTKSESNQGTGLTATNGWINGTITGTKYQIVDFNLTAYGNLTVTPEEISFTAIFELSPPTNIIPANSSDLMFTANASEQYNFTSNLTGTLTWQVNKVVQSNTTDGFIWIVPIKESLASNNIFKIEANNGTNYISWFVSTLNLSESPEFIGDLSDKLYTARTELDPWGRALPNFTSLGGTIDITRGYLNGTKGAYQKLRGNSSIKYGTWILYFKFPNGGNNNYADTVDVSWGNISSNNYYRWQKPADEHIWGQVFNSSYTYDIPVTYRAGWVRGSGLGCISDGLNCENDNDIGIGNGWQKVTIINDKRTGYNLFWMGNNSVANPSSVFPNNSFFVPSAMEYLDDVMPNPQYLYLMTQEDNVAPYSTTDLDMIGIFNETYLYPERTLFSNSTDIIIQNGLNIADPWTLQEINDSVNNVSIFNYTSSTKTAIINANLTFDYGTGFNMTDEILIFNTSSDGQYSWNWRSGLWMNITNSSIHSNGGYYWNIDMFSGTTIRNRIPEKASGYINLVNSNLSNVQGFGFQFRTYIDHFNFSNNYILIDKVAGNGVFNFFDNYGYDFVLRNNTYNIVSDAPDKGSAYWMESEPSTMYDFDSTWLNGFGTYAYRAQKSLINNNISGAAFSSYQDGYIKYKYYADINVTNSTGSPISGATITIHEVNGSDADNIQNMTLHSNHWSWDIMGGSTLSYNRRISTNASNNINFTTLSNGHTALPGWESNTVILTSNRRNQTTTLLYSYTASINDSSKIYTNKNTSISNTGIYTPIDTTASTTITPNESWYRLNPNTYQNTTTISLPQATNWSITPNITISVNASSNKNLTASWDGTATILFNTTIPEWANMYLSLKHDEIVVDTKTSNATGFVSFSYTGLNGDFNITPVYNISGYVNNSVGAAISSVSVTNDTNSNTTNTTGYYLITNMSNGTYNFSYTKTGYITGYKSITVNGADVTNQNVTLTLSSSTITIPANSWGMFNNWSTYNTTFSGIAANESNDVTYTYYNTTSGKWESYYIGYTYNQNNPIGQHNSVLGFFNAETTITADTTTPADTVLLTGWNMLYVEGTSNQTLADIQTNIELSCTVNDLYKYNSTINDYTNTVTESVQPNEGFMVDINSGCTWTRTTI